MDEMIKLAAQNGIWTLMSVFLLIYTLKQNENREKGYQKTIQENQCIIQKLSDTVNVKIVGLEEDLQEIKNKI